MFMNFDDKGNSLGACPMTKKSRKRSHRKRRDSPPVEDQRPSGGESFPRSPAEGTVAEGPTCANADPVPASTEGRNTSEHRCRRNSVSSSTQSKSRKSSPAKSNRTEDNSTSSSGQQDEIRLYLDKLREMVPQAPTNGRLPRKQLIQHVINHICELQQTLENHPGLRGLDPKILAAPGGILNPMQRQQHLLQQRKLQQQHLIEQQQHQQQLYMQQQQQQQQLLQDQQAKIGVNSTPSYYSTPYSRKIIQASPLQPTTRPILQARRDKLSRLRAAMTANVGL